MDHADRVRELIETYRVFHCVECGKCTGACPLAQMDRDFSPRLLAKHVIGEGLQSPYVRERTWTCLTCGLCQERCPIGIRFAEFIRCLRPLYGCQDARGHVSHGGGLHCLMRMQASSGLAQNRTDWITPDLRVSSRGEVLYFMGCLPYFDAFFWGWDLNLREIAVHTVRALNEMGIEPVVLPDERCCGHDLLWMGDETSFHTLRELNVASFHRAGVKTVVTACAECSYVLRRHYPQAAETFPFEVFHLSEYLVRSGFHPGRGLNKTATYQDPCRLGRFQQVYDPPRELLGSMVELREMRHFEAGAWCCGNSAWLGCDRYTKQMQVERLWEARDTKSDLLVTACPKCQIHLTCAMRDANLLGDLQMEIRDLSSVIAESMDRGRP